MLNLSILLLLASVSNAFITIPLSRFAKGNLKSGNFSAQPMTELMSYSNLKNYVNCQYYAKIYAGSPPQAFNVQVSTASPYFWIPSQACKASCHKSSNYFDPYSSSSYQYLNQNVKVTYMLSNFVQGDLSSEAFSIGDSNALYVKNQAFVLVNQDSGFESMQFDGILGLNFFGDPFGYSTFLDNLISQGQITNQVFSVYLKDNNYYGITDGSVLIFGGYDLASYAQSTEIKYADLLQIDGSWQVKLSNVKVNNDPIPSRSVKAYVDIGTSFMLAPGSVITALYNKLLSFGNCWYDNELIACDCYKYAITSYPSISFVLGDYTFSIEPQHYFYKFGKTCYFLFINSGSEDLWIIGDVFMRKYYTIFDVEYFQIGFAIAKNPKTTKFIDFIETDQSSTADLKSEIVADELKAIKIKSEDSHILYWVISGILLAGLSRFIYHSCKRKKEINQEIYYQKIHA